MRPAQTMAGASFSSAPPHTSDFVPNSIKTKRNHTMLLLSLHQHFLFFLSYTKYTKYTKMCKNYTSSDSSTEHAMFLVNSPFVLSSNKPEDSSYHGLMIPDSGRRFKSIIWVIQELRSSTSSSDVIKSNSDTFYFCFLFLNARI